MTGGFFLARPVRSCREGFARTAVAPAVLPLGVVTALLGAPFLAWFVLARS